MCWSDRGSEGRGDRDGSGQGFYAGEALGPSGSRARSARVKDDFVRNVERIESFMLGLDNKGVDRGVGGTALGCSRAR